MGRNRSRGFGFTLVEMMIALVITLLIVFAMVEAFRWIGETTTVGRAVIEMLGQMRHARYRLEDDLSRCTVPLEPWRTEGGQHQGYFEYIEGPTTDDRVDNGPIINAGFPNPPLPLRYIDRAKGPHAPQAPVAPRIPAGYLDANGNIPPGYEVNSFYDLNNLLVEQSGSMFSDVDDIVMFTARNDDKPFRGRFQGNVIESNYAEIIWWAELNDTPNDANGDGTISFIQDANGLVTGMEGANGVWDPGETFTVRRRVLLIRPDLNVNGLIPANVNNVNLNSFIANGANTSNAATNYDVMMGALKLFQAHNDISVRIHFNAGDPTASPAVPPQAAGMAANSLGDLTYRHNRAAHAPLDNTPFNNAPPPVGGVDSAGRLLGLSQGGLMSPIDVRYLPAHMLPDLYGEDVVLNNVLAFDFRAWDPNVPVCQYAPAEGETGEGLLPGDPGYIAALGNAPATVVGSGGFVDLGALTSNNPARILAVGTYNAHFVDWMRPRSFLNRNMLPDQPPVNGNFVYDPWTVVYEKDGYNQDAVSDGMAYAVDEGSDGVDNDRLNGADDKVGETETFPPYPHPLTSVRVHIRMYEPDTRQVRQASHTVRFGIE